MLGLCALSTNSLHLTPFTVAVFIPLSPPKLLIELQNTMIDPITVWLTRKSENNSFSQGPMFLTFPGSSRSKPMEGNLSISL